MINSARVACIGTNHVISIDSSCNVCAECVETTVDSCESCFIYRVFTKPIMSVEEIGQLY